MQTWRKYPENPANELDIYFKEERHLEAERW